MGGLAVAGIGLYQRYVSPYKGFSCAHRVVRRGWSCSEFGKRAFARHDTATAWSLLKRRLARCRTAYEALRARYAMAVSPASESGQHRSEDEQRSKQTRHNDCGIGSCSPGDLGACADVGACDCSPF